MRSATWIRNVRNSVRNAKYCAPIAISNLALRVFLSALSAMRQITNDRVPAMSCGVFSRPGLNQWLLMRISLAGRLFLLDVELELAGGYLDLVDDVHMGHIGPADDIGADAGAVADQLEDLAGIPAVEQLLRLDDRAGAVHAADVEQHVR